MTSVACAFCTAMPERDNEEKIPNPKKKELIFITENKKFNGGLLQVNCVNLVCRSRQNKLVIIATK